MDELLGEFLTETNENLALLDGKLVKFEKNPNDFDLLAQIFRIVHTVKGTCGFLSLDRLEKVAHAAENVLGKLRDKKLTATPDIVTVILQALDKIKDIITILEETEKEPDGNDGQLVEKLNEIAENSNQIGCTKTSSENINASIDMLFSKNTQSVISTPQTEIEPHQASKKIEENDESMQSAELIEKVSSKDSIISAQTIRVHVDLLENLMTLVSELVLTRNQLLQISKRQINSEFSAPLQHLSHITSELQEGVMKTRMQPIGNAWAKLPRMVRDLSIELEKSIDLQLIGSETELDRQVLELIKDPLTHMVRNAADHGIETNQERCNKGKKEVGKIILEAFHEGGYIIIKIQDDGKGLNSEKIKDKILEKNLATLAEIQDMTEQQMHQFIFKPGFSTSTNVTSISGRGVGMDVVRTNIEKIGGMIEFSSILDKGSIFTIKIPLTLAIVSALIVASGKEKFAIPQLNVLELVKTSEKGDHKIETINDAPVLRLREQLLPLISLKQFLKLENEPTKITHEDFIVVTQVGTHNFGIIVDNIFDTEEIVVKPLSPLLKNLTVFSGNTILGDGTVILILDPNGLATASGVTITRKDSNLIEKDSKNSQDHHKIDFLVFKAGSKELKAIPLSLIVRLEEIDVSDIEYCSNERPVIQYRGKLMPLIKVDPQSHLKKTGAQPILVFSDNDQHVGLIVDDIIDIVKDKMSIEMKKTEDGIIGSAIINGKATDVIDMGFYLTKIYNDGFVSKDSIQNSIKNGLKNLLLIDDSKFFRDQLTPFLMGAGYNVTTSKSAEDALDLHEKGYDFDIIVTDIEMPGISGFEFAHIIRNSKKWHDKPIIALSAYTSDENLERGKSLGIENYISKLDRERLLETLAQLS
jgi:two-component system, chemotaxis family, sensor kinase CheA